ncbi:MAG: hypothetical protein ACR2J4_01835 [Deinococcus sp.]
MWNPYYTRVPVHRCSRLGAELLPAALREQAQRLQEVSPGKVMSVPQLAPLLALDWTPGADRAALTLTDERRPDPGTVRVGLDVTETGKPGARGSRLWFRCPRCERRCRAVYASPSDAQGMKLPGRMMVGCRACLGLTDASRQRHKCLDWASAVLGERPYRVTRAGVYRRRGWRSIERAHRVTMASYGRAFRGMGIPMPGEE